MVKNESDIIEHTVRHMLTQVDHVIVADNLSTDGTYDIVDSIGGVTLINDDDPAHYQSRKMTRLAQTALDMGAEWIVPFDADEFWYSPHAGTISEALADSGMHRFSLAPAKMYNHTPTRIDDVTITDPFARIGWRQVQPGALPKVACRADRRLVIHDGNHSADYGPLKGRATKDRLVIRHYPYRTAEQFVRKAIQGAESLRRTDLPESTGAHWRQYAAIYESQGREALEGVFYEWFYSHDPVNSDELIYDPARRVDD